MEEIILTGYSEKEFNEIIKSGKQPGCYFCKREEGDEGVYIVQENGKQYSGTCGLEFEFIEIDAGDKKILYPVCHECALIHKHKEKEKASLPAIVGLGRISLN